MKVLGGFQGGLSLLVLLPTTSNLSEDTCVCFSAMAGFVTIGTIFSSSSCFSSGLSEATPESFSSESPFNLPKIRFY